VELSELQKPCGKRKKEGKKQKKNGWKEEKDKGQTASPFFKEGGATIYLFQKIDSPGCILHGILREKVKGE
jgi:hypothetical protein